jgi:signal transduction histidine kinase
VVDEPRLVLRNRCVESFGHLRSRNIAPVVFKVYYQVSKRNRNRSVYLKNIVEAHGGKLYANNNLNDKGATFTFTIPLFREQK